MNALLPGATLGVLGSGQLGRMFAIAARRLGYRVQVYSPESSTPAGQVADREWTAAYDDADALAGFAREVDVVTLEFENISAAALNQLDQSVPVRPGPEVLSISQNRLREKTALNRFGLPTARFVAVNSLEQLQTGLEKFGDRGVLKTASWGYDGKGQQMLQHGAELDAVWSRFAGAELILEELVDFSLELSVIAVRGQDGEIGCYEPILNEHRNHILDVSCAPAVGIDEPIRQQAMEIARAVMQSLEVVGVMCVEMFLTQSGQLLINEIAPRPHNSGHLTIDAHHVCQFEQQVRSICGLPLGSTAQRQPAAMANLLGDLWQNGTPLWSAVLQHAPLKLHLYGKSEPLPGRKMGHLTWLADDPLQAADAVRAAREALKATGN